MNNKIIEDLVELDVYSSKTITEEEYNNSIKDNSNNNLIYISGRYEYDNEDYNKYFKEIDMKGLSIDDVQLKLEIDKVKNIKSIKSMITFFVVITVIEIIFSFFIGMSLMDTLG